MMVSSSLLKSGSNVRMRLQFFIFLVRCSFLYRLSRPEVWATFVTAAPVGFSFRCKFPDKRSRLRLPIFAQLLLHVLRRAEEIIFHGTFGASHGLGDFLQFVAVKMPQDKHRALPIRERFHRQCNLAAQLLVQSLSFGIRIFVFRHKSRRCFFAGAVHVERKETPAAPPLAIIDALVDDDAIQPRRKLALETERRQAAKNFDENFLIHVLRVFQIVQHLSGELQHLPVVRLHQRLERRAVTFLRAADQPNFPLFHSHLYRQTKLKKVCRVEGVAQRAEGIEQRARLAVCSMLPALRPPPPQKRLHFHFFSVTIWLLVTGCWFFSKTSE